MNIQEALEAAGHVVDVSLLRSVLAGHTAVDAPDEETGQTALHHAVELGGVLLVKALLEKKAKVDAVASDGCTALYLAAFSGHQTIAKLLLASGADVNIPNKAKETPLHTAASGNSSTNVALVDLLLRSGARTNTKDNNGRTPLLRAIFMQRDRIREKTLQLLLQYGAYSDPNDRADKALERFCKSSLTNTDAHQPFYTTLLLAGVRVPEKVLLLEPLQIIQRHIEQTVSAWLAPLALSLEDCARLTPRVLRALPSLQEWLSVVTRSKAQDFGRALYEALISNESSDIFNATLREDYHYTMQQDFKQEPQGEKLLKALWALPKEMRDAVKEFYAPLPLIGLVADRAQATYDLPPKVALYLVENSWNHPEECAAFHRELFEYNDWLIKPYAPLRLPKSYPVEATTSFQRSLA